MENDNKEPSMYNDNNSDLDKETVEIKLSFRASNAQYNYNPSTVKLELFDIILLVFDSNDLKCYEKGVYKVELSIIKYNLYIIKGVKSSFPERNATIFVKLFFVDDGNNIKLCNDAIIRANGHLFNLVTAVSKYVKTFGFD